MEKHAILGAGPRTCTPLWSFGVTSGIRNLCTRPSNVCARRRIFGGADTYRAMILIYAKGSDQQVVKIDGMVTTTMKDGQPNTTFKGKWVVVNAKGALAGIKGEGTYSGQFTAEDNNDVSGCMRSLRYKVGRRYVGG